jgi:hypothetical protein
MPLKAAAKGTFKFTYFAYGKPLAFGVGVVNGVKRGAGLVSSRCPTLNKT